MDAEIPMGQEPRIGTDRLAASRRRRDHSSPPSVKGHVRWFYTEDGITYNTTMDRPSIVMDTSVWIAALGSRLGASFRLLDSIDRRQCVLNVSVPLILEYESVAKREAKRLGLSGEDIDDMLDYLCAVARHWPISYLWRPSLSDPGDEMILELAVTARCQAIVTFNVTDFAAASQFGIRVLRPQAFLKETGELP